MACTNSEQSRTRLEGDSRFSSPFSHFGEREKLPTLQFLMPACSLTEWQCGEQLMWQFHFILETDNCQRKTISENESRCCVFAVSIHPRLLSRQLSIIKALGGTKLYVLAH
jgi:hypothetical protein